MSQQDYAALSGIFETYLMSHQPYGSPDSLYSPIRYINEIGGKRIRPALLLMAYNLWHEDVTPALPAALAVEYFHHFSLMHDDIMDEAPLRRGKQTVHQKFGRNAAILSGDAMMIRCFDLLLQSGERLGVGAQLCELMCKVALEICEGQQMDMDFESLPSPTEAEYIEMIRKKTACLLGVSLQLGAVLAGASERDSLLLYQFGEMMGLGFQIQDDYLDTFGESKTTGKQQGGDILRGKKNFLYVRTYNVLPPPDQVDFVKMYEEASRNEHIDDVLNLFEKQNVKQYAQQVQMAYFEKGVSSLDEFDAEKRGALLSFGESLINRPS